jgi:hypothetical protein
LPSGFNIIIILKPFFIKAFPDANLTVRNLGWSADEVNLQPRPLNFGSVMNICHNKRLISYLHVSGSMKHLKVLIASIVSSATFRIAAAYANSAITMA